MSKGYDDIPCYETASCQASKRAPWVISPCLPLPIGTFRSLVEFWAYFWVQDILWARVASNLAGLFDWCRCIRIPYASMDSYGEEGKNIWGDNTDLCVTRLFKSTLKVEYPWVLRMVEPVPFEGLCLLRSEMVSWCYQYSHICTYRTGCTTVVNINVLMIWLTKVLVRDSSGCRLNMPTNLFRHCGGYLLSQGISDPIAEFEPLWTFL